MAKGKKNDITIRSSAAEYLSYVAAVGGEESSIEMRYEDENIWLTQKMMAELYAVDIKTINQHLRHLIEDDEIDPLATISEYEIVQMEGNRQVARSIKHYSLQAIIAVGFKVNNERAVQFRKWANSIVKDYTIQGWVMDVERLKSGGSVLTAEYFERQLEKIREIRLSERRFYQKITDLYATALDYDAIAASTRRFFAAVQKNALQRSWTDGGGSCLLSCGCRERPYGAYELERITAGKNSQVGCFDCKELSVGRRNQIA